MTASPPPCYGAPGYGEWCADVLDAAALNAYKWLHCKGELYRRADGQITHACALGALVDVAPDIHSDVMPFAVEAGIREALAEVIGPMVGNPTLTGWPEWLAEWSDEELVEAGDVVRLFEDAANVARAKANY